MKNFIFIVTFVLGFQSFAQKTFEIYNFSSYSVDVAAIVTRTSTGGYPEFSSKQYGLFTIPPGGSYTLENTANNFRFPFQSPASVPYMSAWERLTSSTSSSTNFTSPQAWVLGTNQVFNRLHVYINGSYNVQSVPTGQQTLSPWFTDTNNGLWQVDYLGDNPAPNVWYYTIVIYDL